MPKQYYDYFQPNFVSIDRLKGKPLLVNVRNIYTFLVSYYADAKRTFFFDFLVEDSIAARKFKFPDFVKYLSEKTDGWVCKDLIFFQCFAQPGGELVVDWVNRLESIDADMGAFLKTLSVPMANPIDHLNKNVSTDHRCSYDDQTIERVSQTWADDIRLFGFQFDGTYSDDALLYRDTKKWKGRIRYSINSKNLEVSGG